MTRIMVDSDHFKTYSPRPPCSDSEDGLGHLALETMCSSSFKEFAGFRGKSRRKLAKFTAPLLFLGCIVLCFMILQGAWQHFRRVRQIVLQNHGHTRVPATLPGQLTAPFTQHTLNPPLGNPVPGVSVRRGSFPYILWADGYWWICVVEDSAFSMGTTEPQ